MFIVGDDSLVAEYSEIASAFRYAIISLDKVKNLKQIGKQISIALELSNLDLDRKKKNMEDSGQSPSRNDRHSQLVDQRIRS